MKELENFQWFFGNGKISFEYPLVNGKCRGIYKYWLYSGQIRFMDQNKKGESHGIRIKFEY